MTISPLELLSVRADDGLASPAELAELEAAGRDPAAWQAVRPLLLDILLPHASPRLVRDVLAALAGGSEEGGLDRAAVAELEQLDALLAEALYPAGASPAADLVAEVLESTGLEVASDRALQAALRAALVADAGARPELAPAVLVELDLAEESLDDLGALLRGGGDLPELADGVMAAAGLAEPAMLVREALQPPAPAELADEVLARLGLAELGEIGDLLREEAGAAPDLWAAIAADIEAGAAEDEELSALLQGALGAGAAEGAGGLADAVMAELGLALSGDVAEEAEGAVVVPLRRPAALAESSGAAERGGLWLGGLLAAAAAALLVLLPGWMGGDVGPTPLAGQGAFVVAEVDNTAEIEELEAGPDAMVQVFQGEEGAPTIIFINELEEPEGSSGEDGGVPL